MLRRARMPPSDRRAARASPFASRHLSLSLRFYLRSLLPPMRHGHLFSLSLHIVSSLVTLALRLHPHPPPLIRPAHCCVSLFAKLSSVLGHFALASPRSSAACAV